MANHKHQWPWPGDGGCLEPGCIWGDPERTQVLGDHEHHWVDVTTYDDVQRHLACTTPGCTAVQTEPPSLDPQEGEVVTEIEFLGQIDPVLRRQDDDGTHGYRADQVMPAVHLMEWWREEAQQTADQVIPKAVEYGANSLTELGRAMGLAAGRQYTEQEAQEVACFFYIYGKMGRWLDAVVGGYKVGDDTIHDIEVYAKMVKRIRAAGTWPGMEHR